MVFGGSSGAGGARRESGSTSTDTVAAASLLLADRSTASRQVRFSVKLTSRPAYKLRAAVNCLPCRENSAPR